MKITETEDAELRGDRGGSVTVAAGWGWEGRTHVPFINKWTRVMPEGHTAWQRETVTEGVSEDSRGGGGG